MLPIACPEPRQGDEILQEEKKPYETLAHLKAIVKAEQGKKGKSRTGCVEGTDSGNGRLTPEERIPAGGN